jgi:hypothetical protein
MKQKLSVFKTLLQTPVCKFWSHLFLITAKFAGTWSTFPSGNFTNMTKIRRILLLSWVASLPTICQEMTCKTSVRNMCVCLCVFLCVWRQESIYWTRYLTFQVHCDIRYLKFPPPLFLYVVRLIIILYLKPELHVSYGQGYILASIIFHTSSGIFSKFQWFKHWILELEIV